MRYRYYTCDVFTARRFGGNPLAVLPEATGLSGEQMQRIAREFNYSETTFVLPPDDSAHTRKVRIFTPGAEIPFAGHPNIGTAFVLAAIGAVPTSGTGTDVVFEEGAGPVAVAIRCRDGRPVECELTAPRPLALGTAPPVEAVAESVGLSPDVVVTSTHPPRVASAGLPFLCVELRARAALAQARVRETHEALMQASGAEGIHLYTRDTGEPGVDLRARMYAPLHGVAEDPATGSANVALAGKPLDPTGFERVTWAMIEMGRGISAPDYVMMVNRLHGISREIALFFESYDVLLTPTLAEPPVKLGVLDMMSEDLDAYTERLWRFTPFTYPFNVTGQPAMSVPLAWNEAGLPIGVHFVGRYGDEATLFRLAAQLEQARPWADRRPPEAA